MQTSKTTPRDFFLYFGALITLSWSAGSFIALLFRIVDTVFKDQLEYYVDPYSSGIRFAIASLIVVLPVCLLLFRTIKRDAMSEPAKLSLWLRRWFFALAIFITSLAMIGDVIALLNSFLGGELTIRFFLKIVSVLLVAGLVFWYSLLELRIRDGAAATVRKEFLYGTPILVLAAIIYGFFVMGSPATQRSLRFDERRISDLSTVQNEIVYRFWQSKGRLPATLDELVDPISFPSLPVDPESRQPYTYSSDGKETFALCAEFDRGSDEKLQASGTRAPKPVALNYTEFGGQDWSHQAGNSCFERTIDPELYPVRPKVI